MGHQKSSAPNSDSEERAASPAGDSQDTKKRKRTVDDGDENALEIDVSLPAPLSKRELRKAKKTKSDPDSAATARPAKIIAGLDTHEDAKEGFVPTGANAASKRSQYGVWVGNLPWTATRESLRTFLLQGSSISEEDITRINMPAPKPYQAPKQSGPKPQNKGFAYVDFTIEEARDAIIALSETLMAGRRVLIKNSESFEGRPTKVQGDDSMHPSRKANMDGESKRPNTKVFVGNISWEFTKEELVEHYEQCGEIENVHMATFEDSGKCKGYAWITFKELEAAEAAVRGYVMRPPEEEKLDEGDDEDAFKKKSKGRKWFVGKVGNRQLRVEFAEDSQTRYKKRFGHKPSEGREGDDKARDRGPEEPNDDKGKGGYGETRSERRAVERRNKKQKVDARSIAPGKANTNALRASVAIKPSEGKKIAFDD
ncbi:hypothetical protein K402DRAFT_371847 [Aulographum hederae CBS 113979]|uniref:RRM domain-containing protein n=1 Tax=Aulographum hederae CBS 113979 TaxID=1176131 RepID=A0A6G1H9C7_9PEZI|nr:hypothetical protein K402DRAFT_371847 [Aulographum hederae CBS 113979]